MTINDKEIQKLNKTLAKLSRSGLPQASRYTLNEMAKKCKFAMRAEIRNNFTNRNKWTVNSIKVNNATQYEIDDMESSAGSVAPYMKTQQDGGRVKPKQGKNKPIAMDKARTSSSNSKLIQKKYKMRYLDLGGNVFYTKKTKKAGIFVRTGRGKRSKIQKLYDLSNSSIQIDKKDWASKPFRRIANQTVMNKIYYKNANKIIDKLIK